MSGFNKFLLAVLLAAGGYSAWGTFRQKLNPQAPLYPKPYIVVYGRDSCGYCQALRKGLDERRIAYKWKRIDEEPVMKELIPRMEHAGLDVGYFDLPVVDVNAEMMIRPEPETVASLYKP